METDDLKRIGKAMWGRGWQTRFAESLGVAGSSVRRWIGTSDRTEIPQWAEAHIRLMQERQTGRGAFVYARQTIGSPLPTVSTDDAEQIRSISRLLAVPGVEDPKRMPAIVAEDRNGVIGLRMTGDEADEIGVKGVSLMMTRHPDPWHLEGYLSCARGDGHHAVVTRHVDHYYSLIGHSLGTGAVLIHQIATHRGVLRTVRSEPDAPHAVLSSDLRDMLPRQHPPRLPPADETEQMTRGRPAREGSPARTTQGDE